MKKALILTVGTGTRKDSNMVEPLCKALRACNPNFAVLVATRKSKANAAEVAKRCDLARGEYKIIKLTDENDLEKTVLEIEEAIGSVRARGYLPEEIDIDFTSGTKPMSAAAVLSAIRHGCGYLRYVSGDREYGVVTPGREKPLLFPTSSILALRQLDLAQGFIRHFQFGAAKEIIDGIKTDLLSPKDEGLAEELLRIAEAYDRWDKFDHRGFLHESKKLKFQHPATKKYRIGKRTRQILEDLIRVKAKKAHSLSAVADLLDNAERRAYEGKFDDGVARIYRAVEMLGQCRLQERHGIDSSCVDLGKLADQEREALHLSDNQAVPPKIGLAQVYQLLAGRKDKIGLAYLKNTRIQSLLVKRNSSILAHGSESVKESDYSMLLKEVVDLCRVQDRRIDGVRRKLQFPWLIPKPASGE